LTLAIANAHAGDEAPRPDAARRRLRVASYNIYKGTHLGAAGAASSRSIVADLGACPQVRDADVLLVQEAVVGALARTGPAIDAVATLGQAFGLETPAGTAAHVRFLGESHGHAARWGVAVLSRQAARFHDVPLPRPRWSRWPRGAILAEIGSFVVATLHLEVWPIGAPARAQQVAAFLEALAGLPQSDRRPIVVAGDFNCERGAAHDLLLRAGFCAAPLAGPTWRWHRLRLRLDHAYVRGARVLGAGVGRQAGGSDHLPIWVDLDAGDRGAAAFQTAP
jgi:endonuclease/exonuclease/phosphatase family metal-dependent hydrolase